MRTRIAMLVSVPFPPREGIGFYVWNLSRCLQAQGHSVQVITRGSAKAVTRNVIDGLTIWRPRFLPVYPFHVHLHGWFVDRLIRRLESDIDVFHLHSPLVPLLSTSRPVVATFHSVVRHDVAATRVDSLHSLLMKLQSPVSSLIERRLLHSASEITGVSPAVVRSMRIYDVERRNHSITWNGVDVDYFRPALSKKRDRPQILTVARLAPGKGIADLIHALSSIKETHPTVLLTIAGHGPLRRKLERLVSSERLTDNVRFLGHVSERIELLNLYWSADIFVLPSYHEGLPTVILEAMACGLPVVATKVGGIPELISEGREGFLLPPGQPLKLAASIRELLDDGRRRCIMGREARQTVEEKFAWQKIARGYVDLYEKVSA